jgi:undecaprenyl-diphosphatase
VTEGQKRERMDQKMRTNRKRKMLTGITLLSAFVVWTVMILTIDVQPVGQNGTEVGFATINVWFHKITGVHMLPYTISDWLGLVPIVICMCFGMVGFIQLIKRKSLLKVDRDIIWLGVYYILVIMGYLFFEMVPVNYRPVLIDGRLEASYPSSTTLLVLSVMPTLKYQADRRIESLGIRKAISIFTLGFSLFMVACRIISGVHWLTDIVGSFLLSFGLFMIYTSVADSRDSMTVNCDREISYGV